MLDEFLTGQLNMSADAAALTNKIVAFLLILIATWLVRRVVSVLLPRLIGPLTRRTGTHFDDRLVIALTPPLRLFVTVLGISMALLALELPTRVNTAVGSVVNSFIAFAVFWTMFRLVDPIGDLIAWLYGRTSEAEVMPDALLSKLTQVGKQLVKGLLVILGFAAILEAWSLDVNGLIAGFGIAGAAVALATKDTLANLLGYFVILADEPFNEGEYVVFSGVSGTVEHIGFRSTRVRGLDQSLVTVPNNTIMNANVTNWSRLTKRRLNMTLGVEYSSSPEQVLSVVQAIREMLQEHEAVESESVVVQFTNFNDSTLDIIIICFMKIPAWGDFQAAKQDINLRIMDLLEDRGVEIAFPTRTIVLESAPPPHVLETALPLKPEMMTATATVPPVPNDAADDAAEDD